ncbi:MAG: hypothetical protein Q7U88_07070 [Desulfocapsaceae bacterium]|nr:hypothetical protein [Desulfocapsaceae bacterium]
MSKLNNNFKKHLSALTELRNIAARKGQIGAAVAAEVALGKAMGLYQDEQNGDKQAQFTEAFKQLIEKLPN